jgi:protein-disulfide isomerase
MKKNITILVIVLLALGFGFYLFKISPQPAPAPTADTFDFSKVKDQTEPSPVTSEDHIQGNVNAKNTFIVYEDFQCPACAAINEEIKKVSTEFPDTRLVFRHFPLIQIHKNAVIAAYASESANAQGKFWEMKDKLYENQSYWSDMNYPQDKFMDYAKEIGIQDLEKFKKDIENKTYKSRVEKDLIESASLKLEGTPTLMFNGVKLKTASVNAMKKQAEELKLFK